MGVSYIHSSRYLVFLSVSPYFYLVHSGNHYTVAQMCNLGQHLEEAEVAALLLGALIHDYKHPGRSNAFLTKTGHALALTYNDVSVLENFHLSEVGPAPREMGWGCRRLGL